MRAGHRVLVNGAAGGVGTYAVQIAAALGAEVTGVCSTRNAGLVRSIGAAHVVDYQSATPPPQLALCGAKSEENSGAISGIWDLAPFS